MERKKKVKIEGATRLYYKSGQLKFEVNFVEDKLEGHALMYYESGSLKSEINFVGNKQVDFKAGRTKNGTPVFEDETDIPFLWISYKPTRAQ